MRQPPKAVIWGVDIEVGAVAMGTFFSNDNKTFASSGTFRFSYEQADKIIPTQYNGNPIPANDRKNLILELTNKDISVGISGPTVVGAKSDSVKIIYAGDPIKYNGNELTLNKNVTLPVTGYLEELPALPLAAPQLTIGTLYGTMVSIRYLPNVKINDKLGDFKYFGFGIQHNFSMWLPFPMPLEVSAGFFTQSMNVGTVFECSATTYGLYASKKFGWGALNVTPYVGLSLETSSVDIKFDQVVTTDNVGSTATIPVSFSLDGENSSRLTVGASFKLGFLSLTADYNVAKYNAFSAGVGFIF